MKDKDIVKALRTCADRELGCSECNMNREPSCINTLRTLAADRIEELHKKNKAKKAKYQQVAAYGGRIIGECPSCGQAGNDRMKYCPECGQKLKWR